MRSDLFDDFTEPSDWTPVASGPAPLDISVIADRAAAPCGMI